MIKASDCLDRRKDILLSAGLKAVIAAGDAGVKPYLDHWKWYAWYTLLFGTLCSWCIYCHPDASVFLGSQLPRAVAVAKAGRSGRWCAKFKLQYKVCDFYNEIVRKGHDFGFVLVSILVCRNLNITHSLSSTSNLPLLGAENLCQSPQQPRYTCLLW